MRKIVAALSLVLPSFLSLSLASLKHAEASPDFPSTMRAELEMECTPTCIVCHTTQPGQNGTAEQSFAGTLIALGLEGGNEESLADALAALPPESDSDADLVTDLDELKAALPSNPSDVADTPDNTSGVCAAEVVYGCGAQMAPTALNAPGSYGAFFLLALACAWRIVRRRRASHQV